MNENWYVYKHVRLDINQPFYIGIGNKKNHFRAYEIKKRNKHWSNIYNKTKFLVEIVCENVSKIEASQKEKELISIYGRMDLGNGILCNMTDGGDGIWNCKRSEETKRLLSLKKIGNKNHRFGIKQSDETLKKRFINAKGRKASEQSKIKKSLASIKSGQAKKTVVFDYNTKKELGVFHSMSEACRKVGLDPIKHSSKACMVANGKRNFVKGYSFKYV